MINYKNIINLYATKKVMITGNTGFKGSWLTKILLNAGAEVIGYSLKPSVEPNLFDIADLLSDSKLSQSYGDVRDLENLKFVFKTYRPDIVIHLAAQPIVRESYRDPVTTYNINVIGTVNVCECIRLSKISEMDGGLMTSDWDGVKSFLNVTTDKVYKNHEWEYGYREIDPLDGFDPYSNSKSCSELVTHSYRNSFFADGSVAVSTARAGNVIGGGDFSVDRIIPDCVKSVKNAYGLYSTVASVGIRNPYSTRPYQHVLEPLFAYLMIAIKQFEDNSYAGYYNVGSDDCDCINTGDLVTLFCDTWNKKGSNVTLSWENKAEENAPHEAELLKLDCSKIKASFGWKPRWHIEDAIRQTVNWTDVWISGEDVKSEMNREIDEYLKG